MTSPNPAIQKFFIIQILYIIPFENTPVYYSICAGKNQALRQENLPECRENTPYLKLKINSLLSLLTSITEPGAASPPMILRESGVSSSRMTARFRGLAPKSGS